MAGHLFLLGFMGTGKSTLGPLVAERRGCPFVDLDARIADDAGKSIVDIFRYDGEDAFRAIELRVLAAMEGEASSVVSCGGGVVTRSAAIELIDRLGTGVMLTADASLLVARTEQEHGRPLLNAHGPPAVSVRYLLDQRASMYAHFPATIDTSLMQPEELAALVEERAAGRAGIAHIPVGADPPDYHVHMGHGILGGLGDAVAGAVAGPTAVVITNPTVAEHYQEPVEAALRDAGFDVHVALMPDGEQYKTLATCEKLYDECLAAGIDRRSVIVALGGGVVGDVAGFIAATVLRGIAVVQVPTTLLAMVDSSIGGKTGVDSARGKNLIGAFHRPKLVWADLATLDTLPESEYVNGLAEVVKYAMIADPFWPSEEWPAETPVASDATLLAYLETHADVVLQRDPAVLAAIVERSAGHKARVVTADEFEGGVRSFLNYGHTIGHALETAAGFEALTHGQGVALGMIAAGRLAVETGRLTSERAQRVEALIGRLGLPTRAPKLPKQQVLDALRHDKKAVAGTVRFVLARAIGAAELADDVPPALVEAAVEELGCV